jgi:hypothetical protein
MLRCRGFAGLPIRFLWLRLIRRIQEGVAVTQDGSCGSAIDARLGILRPFSRTDWGYSNTPAKEPGMCCGVNRLGAGFPCSSMKRATTGKMLWRFR